MPKYNIFVFAKLRNEDNTIVDFLLTNKSGLGKAVGKLRKKHSNCDIFVTNGNRLSDDECDFLLTPPVRGDDEFPNEYPFSL